MSNIGKGKATGDTRDRRIEVRLTAREAQLIDQLYERLRQRRSIRKADVLRDALYQMAEKEGLL